VERLGALIAMVRRALVARAIVRASGPIALASGVAVLVAAAMLPGLARAPWLALLVLGPLVGFVRARRDAPSEADIVLHLDQRLGAGAALVTAWECARAVRETPLATLRAALAALGTAEASEIRPRILARSSWLLGLAAGVWALVFVVPGPAPARVAEERHVRLANVDALRRIERLPEEARTPEERRSLDDAARKARALADDLHEGMEPRDALDRVASLRAQLEAARPHETAAERRARDAAVEALATEPALRDALAARDLEALDRAVERAAARREAADRERAREALQAAARAAAAAGDASLERSLLRRDALLERRARQAALARELLEAMPELRAEGMQRALTRLERDGEGDDLTRETVDAMREAWSRLSAEERRRFAEAVRDMQVAQNDVARDEAAAASDAPLSADELERRLREALANLDATGAQIARASTGAGGIPLAQQGAGQGNGQGQGAGQGQGNGQGQGAGQGNGQGQGNGNGQGNGQGGGDGPGPRGGETRVLADTGGPLVRVRPLADPGALPSSRVVMWESPEGQALPEGLAGGGATGQGVAGDVGAVERAGVPEEYQAQIRRFFEAP